MIVQWLNGIKNCWLSLRGAIATKQSPNVRGLLRQPFGLPRNDMKRKYLSLCLIISLLLFFCPLNAQELRQETNEPEQSIPVVSGFLYGLQRYSGFNVFVHFFAETAIKTMVKLKTHARDIDCNLEIFSGWDLIKKKVKSFHLDAKDLYVKNVPVEYLEITVPDPIYFRKNLKKKNKIVFPVNISSKVIINPTSVIEMVDSMAKLKTNAHEIELPLPPFGKTKVLLQDLMIQISENGFLQSTLNAVSVINPDSEPLKAMFSGNIVISDKRLIVSDLQCEIEDIFTKDSDVSMSFCEAVADLINPVVNFHKYEKRGITIDNVALTFPENKLVLKINLMLSPEKTNVSK